MAKQRKSEEQVKTRTFKVLLYADNPEHMKILETIQTDYPENYLGIWHTLKDENGEEIIEGSGKKHCHLCLRFPNPVWWSAIAKKLGFVMLGGEADYQFIRALKYDDTRETYEGFLVYLIHKNAPDKEQYTLGDLWGSSEMRKDADRAVLHYENRKIEMCDAVLECLRWIQSQTDYISYTDFGYWACSNPWFKGASSPIVRAALDEHNAKYRGKENEGI